MSLHINNTASSLIIKGDVDIHSSPLLLKALQQHHAISQLDLLGVTSLDHAGVATLIEALRLAQQRNLSISFHHVPDCVRNAWQLAGVTDLFDKLTSS